MTPNTTLIKIDNNLNHIKSFLEKVLIYQIKVLNQWATLTLQTPAAKIGYIGQHIASLITGIQGTCSGARGDDLEDGTEVKSCNRIDQSDKCKDCGARVMRSQKACPNCGSSRINRNNDSKWLFSVRDDDELQQYLSLDRILLILFDYPNFKDSDFTSIRISSFEIYPKDQRMRVFDELISNHYYNIYKPKALSAIKTNPMNLHPFSIQFYKCNPILSSINMPSSLLNEKEWAMLLANANYNKEIRPFLVNSMTKKKFIGLSMREKAEMLPYIDEHLRSYIPLRDIVSNRQKKHYHRHQNQA